MITSCCHRAVLLTLLWSTFTFAEGPVHRFGLFLGQNEGGEGTRALLYAREDARRLHEVFVRLGGVKPEDAMLLLDEPAEDVTTALGELERRVRDAKARGEVTSLLVYFSGHARDGSLRLGTTKLPLEALKTRLATGLADTRLAFLDTCRSGDFLKDKGVRRAPVFEVETDATRQAKGLVIVTAAATDEGAQESDLIAGSYFSYYLATGLLGSADAQGDGRVTLGEAFAWAYERTLASAAVAPLEPPPLFDLQANADVPLTDLAARGEGLRIPSSAPTGPYFVIDPRGVVVAETVKGEGDRLLALPPGAYVLKRRLADHLRLGRVEIADGQFLTLDEGSFQNAKFTDDPVRGTGVSSSFSRHWSLAVSGQYQVAFGDAFPSAPLLGGEATLHNVFFRGFSLSIDGSYGWMSGSLQAPLVGAAAYNYTLVTFGGSLWHEWFQDGRFVPFVGVHVGFDIFTRTFTDSAIAQQGFSTFTPGVVGGLKVRISKSISVIARARVHYLLFNVDETRSLGNADFGALLDYEFKD